MFKLMVSYDCGVSYREERTVDDTSLLNERCEELDEQQLRWAVRDETGDIVRVCKIHAQILAVFDRLEKEKR